MPSTRVARGRCLRPPRSEARQEGGSRFGPTHSSLVAPRAKPSARRMHANGQRKARLPTSGWALDRGSSPRRRLGPCVAWAQLGSNSRPRPTSNLDLRIRTKLPGDRDRSYLRAKGGRDPAGCIDESTDPPQAPLRLCRDGSGLTERGHGVLLGCATPVGVDTTLELRRVRARVTGSLHESTWLTCPVTRHAPTLATNDGESTESKPMHDLLRPAKLPAEWPSYPLAAWYASDRMADLVKGAAHERLARSAGTRRPASGRYPRILRTAADRISRAIAAIPGRRGRQAPTEPAAAGHRDPASA
jgi:hypothetical protein